MAGRRKRPKADEKILCHLLNKYVLAREHIDQFCDFYAVKNGPKATLGNQACHNKCGVPSKYGLHGD